MYTRIFSSSILVSSTSALNLLTSICQASTTSCRWIHVCLHTHAHVHRHTHRHTPVHCISHTAFEDKAHKYNSLRSTFSFLAEMDDLRALLFYFLCQFFICLPAAMQDMIKCALAIVRLETNYCASARAVMWCILRPYLYSRTHWLTVESILWTWESSHGTQNLLLGLGLRGRKRWDEQERTEAVGRKQVKYKYFFFNRKWFYCTSIFTDSSLECKS